MVITDNDIIVWFSTAAKCVLNSTPVDKQNVAINHKNTQPLLSLFSGGENILKEETQFSPIRLKAVK